MFKKKETKVVVDISSQINEFLRKAQEFAKQADFKTEGGALIHARNTIRAEVESFERSFIQWCISLDPNAHLDIKLNNSYKNYLEGFDAWGLEFNIKSPFFILLETLNALSIDNTTNIVYWKDKPWVQRLKISMGLVYFTAATGEVEAWNIAKQIELNSLVEETVADDAQLIANSLVKQITAVNTSKRLRELLIKPHIDYTEKIEACCKAVGGTYTIDVLNHQKLMIKLNASNSNLVQIIEQKKQSVPDYVPYFKLAKSRFNHTYAWQLITKAKEIESYEYRLVKDVYKVSSIGKKTWLAALQPKLNQDLTAAYHDEQLKSAIMAKALYSHVGNASFSYLFSKFLFFELLSVVLVVNQHIALKNLAKEFAQQHLTNKAIEASPEKSVQKSNIYLELQNRGIKNLPAIYTAINVAAKKIILLLYQMLVYDQVELITIEAIKNNAQFKDLLTSYLVTITPNLVQVVDAMKGLYGFSAANNLNELAKYFMSVIKDIPKDRLMIGKSQCFISESENANDMQKSKDVYEKDYDDEAIQRIVEIEEQITRCELANSTVEVSGLKQFANYLQSLYKTAQYRFDEYLIRQIDSYFMNSLLAAPECLSALHGFFVRYDHDWFSHLPIADIDSYRWSREEDSHCSDELSDSFCNRIVAEIVELAVMIVTKNDVVKLVVNIEQAVSLQRESIALQQFWPTSSRESYDTATLSNSMPDAQFRRSLSYEEFF